MSNTDYDSQIREFKMDIKVKYLEIIIKKHFDDALENFVDRVRKLEQGKRPPLSIQQLADRYEVSKATVHNWMKQGLITGFKMGKGRFFHIEEVEKNLIQYRYLDIMEDKGLIEKRNRIS